MGGATYIHGLTGLTVGNGIIGPAPYFFLRATDCFRLASFSRLVLSETTRRLDRPVEPPRTSSFL